MQAHGQAEAPPTDRANLERIVLASPVLSAILSNWFAFRLPDCWLAGGAIAQTVWNSLFGFPPQHGLRDLDLVYFDEADLSETQENRHVEGIRGLFRDCDLKIDVKNEARVHLWYAAKFGKPIPPYPSSAHAIATFPTTATTIGICPDSSGLRIEASYGLAGLFNLIVRPNKVLITRAVYETKIARWRSLWPGLNIWPPRCFQWVG
jgi:hypothetical protein